MTNVGIDYRSSRTGEHEIGTYPPDSTTGGSAVLNRVAQLRDHIGDLDQNVAQLDANVRRDRLDRRTAEILRTRSAQETLEDLSHRYALSWSLIAHLTGVTATAVRKWRRGERPRPEHVRSIARLGAFIDVIRPALAPTVEPATWLEVPISDASRLRPADLYVADKLEPLFELVTGRLAPNEALVAFDPDWRTDYPADRGFAVDRTRDGELVITERV